MVLPRASLIIRGFVTVLDGLETGGRCSELLEGAAVSGSYSGGVCVYGGDC